MSSIFKNVMLIFQSKAILDEKILFGKIIHLQGSKKLKKTCTGFVWESRTPRSILVHDLFGIEIQI